MLPTCERQKYIPPRTSGILAPVIPYVHAVTLGVQPTPLITRLRPQEGSESGQLSARGVELTQTPTAALQADVLTIVPTRVN